VIREGDRAGVSTPICRALARMIHEIEEGKRPLQMSNYAELARAAGL
jgi:2-dehydropantoate 2-reductase